MRFLYSLDEHFLYIEVQNMYPVASFAEGNPWLERVRESFTTQLSSRRITLEVTVGTGN